MHAALCLGSNIGEKISHIDRAIQLIGQSKGIKIVKRSGNYRTEPWGNVNQDWFVNVCLLVDTVLDAKLLLNRCLEIEREIGRIRRSRWGPREIDIDILLYGEEKIDQKDLHIPHPRMMDRVFVLVPLAEIWPDVKINGISINDVLATRNDLDDVQLLE